MTTYGLIGIKVWVYKGEHLAPGEQPAVVEEPKRAPRRPRGDDEGRSDKKPAAKRVRKAGA
jgi:small subunit ribosomal protein S3